MERSHLDTEGMHVINTDDASKGNEKDAKKTKDKKDKGVTTTHIVAGVAVTVATVAVMCGDAIKDGWNWVWYKKMGNYARLTPHRRKKLFTKLAKLKKEQSELGIDQKTFNKKIDRLLVCYEPKVQVELKQEVGIC